jgi:ferredoxin
MKFRVDPETCIGCGACETTCPEVFKLVNDTSQVQLSPVPEAAEADALSAEEGCPVSAISHTP